MNEHMRRNMIRLLFLPATVMLWIIGWTLLWAGTRKEQETQRNQPKAASQDESVKMTLICPEEQHEA